MSVDEVIALHRKRLDQHRQFLTGGASQAVSDGPQLHNANASRATPRSVSPPQGARQASTSSSNHSSKVRNKPRYSATPNGNEGDDEDLLSERLAAVGKYYTKDPDRMYDRTTRWLHSKKQRVDEYAADVRKEKFAECTFVPNKERSKTPTGSRNGGSAVNLFTANTDATVSDDFALKHFLQRQKDARALREQREKRIQGADGSSWQPVPTVPLEFDFSRKMVSIPALRKPVLLEEQMNQRLGQSSGRWSPPTASGMSFSRDTGISPNKGPSNKNNRADADGGSPASKQEYQPRAGSPATGRKRDDLVLIREELKRLSAHSEDKDKEVASLKGVVSALQRELEVAKATVRKMSLLTTN